VTTASRKSQTKSEFSFSLLDKRFQFLFTFCDKPSEDLLEVTEIIKNLSNVGLMPASLLLALKTAT